MRDLGPLDDLGHSPRCRRAPAPRSPCHRSGGYGSRRTSSWPPTDRSRARPSASVEPVLAVQRHLGPVEQLRRRPLHLCHLRALLTGVEPVPVASNRARSRRPAFSRSTVGAARASSHIQASPTGASPAPTSQVPSPCAVTAIAAVRRARFSTFSPSPRSACTQSNQVRSSGWNAEPSAPVVVAVEHRRRGDLRPAEIEGHGLDDRRPRIDPDQDVGAVTHRALRRSCNAMRPSLSTLRSPHRALALRIFLLTQKFISHMVWDYQPWQSAGGPAGRAARPGDSETGGAWPPQAARTPRRVRTEEMQPRPTDWAVEPRSRGRTTECTGALESSPHRRGPTPRAASTASAEPRRPPALQAAIGRSTDHEHSTDIAGPSPPGRIAAGW